MHWQTLADKNPDKKVSIEEIIGILLQNRGIVSAKDKKAFLSPPHPDELVPKDFGIAAPELKKAVGRINQAIDKNESTVVYGDYDADGVCATAILWENLYRFNKKTLPYIPERASEGYGLNVEAIKALKEKDPELSLIITVDHGIVAGEKIEFARKLGIEVVVCDHHQIDKAPPVCQAVVHTDEVCATAIAWVVAKEVAKARSAAPTQSLDLVAIATITDLEPLVGINRSLVKHGLEALNQTRRCGLLAIFEEAGIKLGEIGTYEVGYVIGPRLNAAGRIDHALESLRLVCTPKSAQAKELAAKLSSTNKERQALTEEAAVHAREHFLAEVGENIPELIFISHESYEEGVIGLAAGKLTEEFCRPAIVVAQGKQYSKASARSIKAFNIIEAIQKQADLLVDAGGHPMAAGFTVETGKIALLKERLLAEARNILGGQQIEKSLKIDMALPLEAISRFLWDEIQKLAPFGLGNPEPVFSAQAEVGDFRAVGNGGKHLKLGLMVGQKYLAGIAFGQGHLAGQLTRGQKVDLAYCLSLNCWNGRESLEIRVRDILLKSDEKGA
jgi:single-stranded-DNA-specific exonuclease